MTENLLEKGVKFDRLVIANCGADQYLGQADGCDGGQASLLNKDPPSKIYLYNAKRFARYEMRHPQNPNMVIVDFMVGDIDFINKGTIIVTPTMMYFINDQDIDCKISMANLYLEYFERKVQAKAAEAGLYTPVSGLIKGK